MRFPDDKEEVNQENIIKAECERKQGNDDIRHCNNDNISTNNSNNNNYYYYFYYHY